MHNMGFQYCSKWSRKDPGVIQMVSGGGLDVPGVLGHTGGVWTSLGMSEWFQVIWS